MEIFLEFTSIVILAAVISIVMRILKQPLVIGYLLTGVLIGPQFLNLMHSTEYIELFSKIGITILLFIVGLHLSPNVIKEVGKVSFIGGLGQIVLTAFYGYIASKFLGISNLEALYMGAALAFSSTIIILKVLSDKGQLQKLHGKISVGILLMQDLVAILLLIIVSSFSGEAGNAGFASVLSMLALKTVAIFIALFIVSKYFLQRLITFLAKSQELLFLFSLGWALGLACVFYLLGLSVEVGALVAGVTLSVTPFADGVASRLKPLRDFFIVLFFILLGSQMVLGTIPAILFPAIVLSLFVLIIKPLIVFLLLNELGYKTRTAFETGISLGQVSEFSLILATLGLGAGHLSDEVLSLITLVAMVTIAGSSYVMLQSDAVYSRLRRLLKHIELKKNKNEMILAEQSHDLILFGFDNVGHDFIEAFAKLEKNYVVVDMNPALIKQMQQLEVPHKYGDAEDIELLEELNLKSIQLCVSTIPDVKVNSLLVKTIRSSNAEAIVIVRAQEVSHAKELYELGATYVVMPQYLGAKYATKMIARLGLSKRGFAAERKKHLLHVNNRQGS